ncbi:type VI secretion system Vgr family protein [Chelatococcus asaccharovorans]|uniref:type VI secretion system Vgr family protein n=1 Tax=Chelatococcus asaccharovorans TaxID=28210 RepID=UPI00224C777A|nr:type VI secretion system tip protein TssI/VgrG [Chelatococcus asaccharovorans]CAH1662016.1 VgrG protein [Chelatococcus asaccharovorans]CAH1683295.1 VgrG protein [Chelatococcus asaccharovorans]
MRIEGPSEQGFLSPYSLRCDEALSCPFDLRVGALSSREVLEPEVLLGKVITVFVANPAGQERIFSGVVRDFRLGDLAGRGQRHVALTVVPRLALLQRSHDNRVFQDITVIDVVKRILQRDHGHDIECLVSGKQRVRGYIVQYGETTREFVERILAEDGFFYYFRHERGRHVMVIGDDSASFPDHADGDIEFSANAPIGGGLTAWHAGFAAQLGRYTLGGFDELKPSATVRETATAHHRIEPTAAIESYHYSGLPLREGLAAEGASCGIEREECGFRGAHGESLYARLAPGVRCRLSRHPVSAERGGTWAVTAVSHEAAAGDALPEGGSAFYRNSFRAIPIDTRFRPPLRERPPMPGPQTATVVGEAGEEIVCDAYGRIKVQFHWDRDGKRDEHSSCWIRVMQPVAGNRWGAIFIPRVGQEVVVQFLEGNPDQPLVTGSVYNGDNHPPWALPAAKTQSGIVTRTTPGGQLSNANILRFDDKKGSEEVWIRAERDSRRETVHDETITVGHDQSICIDHDRSLTVNNGSDSVVIAKGNGSVSVREGNYTLDAARSITLSCGESAIELSPSGIEIRAAAVTIRGTTNIDIDGELTNVNGTSFLVLKGGIVRIN